MVRVKRRYFVFQIHLISHPTNEIKSSHLHTALEEMIARLYGDVGLAHFIRALSIIYYNPTTHTAIVRCLREDKHMLRTAATFVSRLGTEKIECSMQTLHVGGSIRQCKKYLVKYCTQQLLEMNTQSKSTTTNNRTYQVKSKKKKSTQGQQSRMEINDEKQIVLQRLLADSRLESLPTISSKTDDEMGRRKKDSL